MNKTASTQEPITIKKYANRRLYNTSTSTYVTLEDLGVMVKEGVEFNVCDAKSGDDITHSVLTQIIVEEEGKTDQQNLLPVNFLRQIIGLYGNNMQWMVPQYLDHSMDMFSSHQEQMKSYLQNTFGQMFPFGASFEEMSKQNMVMFEQAMRMFAPFGEEGGVMSSVIPKSMMPLSSSEPKAQSKKEKKQQKKKEEEAKQEEPKKEASCIVLPKEETKVEVKAEPVAAPVVTAPVKEEVVAEKPAPVAAVTPMPHVQSASAVAAAAADDMQEKIANLQKQLAELSSKRG